jgi:hypothetical protein
MKNKHGKFWLAVGSGITMVMLFAFIIGMAVVGQFNFKKEYCLFLIPILVYAVAQFVINYCEITEE